MVSHPSPEPGPGSAGILQSADARCGALYRCSEAAIPPYSIQIVDLETQHAYNYFFIDTKFCTSVSPRVCQNPPNKSTI